MSQITKLCCVKKKKYFQYIIWERDTLHQARIFLGLLSLNNLKQYPSKYYWKFHQLLNTYVSIHQGLVVYVSVKFMNLYMYGYIGPIYSVFIQPILIRHLLSARHFFPSQSTFFKNNIHTFFLSPPSYNFLIRSTYCSLFAPKGTLGLRNALDCKGKEVQRAWKAGFCVIQNTWLLSWHLGNWLPVDGELQNQ